MKASSAAAWLAVGLARLGRGGARGRTRAGRAVAFPDRRRTRRGRATCSGRAARRRGAGADRVGLRTVSNAEGLVDPVQGPGHADLHGGRSGAGGHSRLRPRGRRPAVLHRERGHAGGHGNVGDAAQPPTARRASSCDAAGNTTLTLPAAAGDTNLKVASVDELHRRRHAADRRPRRRRSRPSGRRRASTTLFAAAPAGDTNVKVAATTGLATGDALRVDGETVTITNVGTQGRDTTLSAAAAAGATNIKVASVTGMAAGDPIVVGGESGTIQTVGTAGRQRHRA